MLFGYVTYAVGSKLHDPLVFTIITVSLSVHLSICGLVKILIILYFDEILHKYACQHFLSTGSTIFDGRRFAEH